MLRLDRSRRAGRFLPWKIRIFSVGATLAVAGIYLDDRRLTGAAIVILLVGALIRFAPGTSRQEEPGDGGGDDAGG